MDTSISYQNTLHKTDGPVFIVGASRSGTTWLQSLILLDPGISSLPETKFFQWVLDPKRALSQYDKYPQKAKPIPERIGPKALEVSFGHLDEIGLVTVSAEAKGRLRHLASEGRLDPSEYLDTIMRDSRDGSKSRATRWVEKTPKHILFLSSIFRYFPSARVVCVYRDPVDIMLSTNRNFHVPYMEGLRDLTNCYKAFEVFSKNNPDRTGQIMSIAYEDMKNNIGIVNDVMKFIGCDPVPVEKLKIGAEGSFISIYGDSKMAVFQPQMSGRRRADREEDRELRGKIRSLFQLMAKDKTEGLKRYLDYSEGVKRDALFYLFLLSEIVKFLFFHMRVNLSHVKQAAIGSIRRRALI